MQTNHYNAGQDLKGILTDAGMTFLSNLVNAKKQGQELPKALDAVASIAVDGQQAAIEIAKKEAREQTMKQISWIIAGVLAIVVVYLLITRKK